ncbi:lipid-A-disaccharide synthase [Glaciecola sp. KUL10]|uniref:lipid-A-disaccharide synthase n=1 Tax=Glaciecola sp. (strain KUL10) TaxID=2161813 RepID=UPI000D782176|nr:lipid-A-disaccharide synthase [Glaciecola sp. KUL10]GBL04123.1 tetraacyldisaccharide-1-P synthase [Glaciecola sp. KUL10]
MTVKRIAIIAGEPSGDVLAAGVIRELKLLYPDAVFEGIGGKHMQAEGFVSLYDMDSLSVMGLVEVLKHLPTLLSIRKSIKQHFVNNPPDVFVGVDAPDFNLSIETYLKKQGIKTVHYVSPTVWAWREKRIYKIINACDLVLGIFPFEKAIYDKYKHCYQYVGHTMADAIDISPDFNSFREMFSLKMEQKCLALLPGSRAKEVASLLPVFLQTATLLIKKLGLDKSEHLKVIIPAANKARASQIHSIIEASDTPFDLQVTEKSAREVMLASDAVLLASGTASLEAMLCKKPMVVTYKMSTLTYKIMKRLYKPNYFALPNILADKLLVPELLQEDVNPELMCKQLALYLNDEYKLTQLPKLIDEFNNIHSRLRLGADKKSAEAIQRLLENTAK